jgi:hypothetical protein
MKQITLDEWDIKSGATGLLKKLYLSDYKEKSFKSHQENALYDIERFVKTIPHALEFLFDRRFVRWDKVMERDSYKCKPRITLYPHITQKGNLSFLWKPTGNVHYHHAGKTINETDFNESHDIFLTGDFERPKCELLFIHEIEHLMFDISSNSADSQISALLIGAACAAMESFKDFLMGSFEVTTEHWFELTFDKGTICKFDIVNVAEREAKKEKVWFHGFRRQYGIEPKEFITLFKNERTSGKVIKILKGKGINIDWREVRRVAERLKNLHSDAWSD